MWVSRLIQYRLSMGAASVSQGRFIDAVFAMGSVRASITSFPGLTGESIFSKCRIAESKELT
jgi:hypothetical protein